MLLTIRTAGCVKSQEELEAMEEDDRKKAEAQTPVIDPEEISRWLDKQTGVYTEWWLYPFSDT